MLLLENSLIISVSFILTLIMTIFVRRVLLKRAVLDRPNERSSHTEPTPRGGGWALLFTLIPGLVFASILTLQPTHYLPLIVGVVLLALISWWDDMRSVKPSLRLGVHLLAALMGSFSLPDHAMLFGGLLPFVLDRLIMIVGWAWFMNLTNFMDGIDGITGVETIAISTGASLVLTLAGVNDPFIDILTLLLTGASLGFLALNWHPAKIFLGDVGSVPMGYLSGFILIIVAANSHLLPAIILPLYYLADSGITITKRALRGEKIWQAHRQHFYQRAAAALGRHDRVVLPIILANIALIAAALIALMYLWMGAVLAVFVVVLLLNWMHKVSINRG
jgi:UDP-N-acetylmuramyl pentapeptide phosphotransferase/UDP-N-acetylglucosamine-1-phosphate transferase